MCLLIFSLFLKLHNYTVYPQRGATSDEYTYTFLGLSLFQSGVPVSWSFFPYPHRSDITIGGILFPLVYPYFDHPPLAGLVVGAWSMLWGQNTFNAVQLSTIRIVPIFFSTVSALFVFLLAQKLFDTQTAWWALTIYVTAPVFVISSRVVVAENLLTPVMLAAVYLYSVFQRKKTVLYSVFLAILAGFGFLMKESGIVLWLYLAYMFIRDRTKLNFFSVFSAIFALFVAAYTTYGFLYDRDLFLKILFLQSARQVGPQTLWYILSTPIIINKVYQDGWYYFGMFCLLWSFGKTKYAILTPLAFTYLLYLLTSLTREGQSGWYLIPLFPFMAMASAQTIREALKAKSWFILVFVLFIGMFMVQQIFEPNFGLVPMQFRFLTGILVVPLVLAFLAKKGTWVDKVGTAWFYLFILGNIFLTLAYKHPA